MRRSRQGGAALLLAVLIAALATSAAALTLVRQDLWIRQAESLAARAQVDAAAASGLMWAHRAIAYPYGPPGPEPAFDGVRLEVRRLDAQGAFNLNSLRSGGRVSDPELQLFRRLLAELGLPATLADAAASAVQPPLIDVGQLARFEGFTPEALARLRPFINVLPEPTPLNVNSAPPELLVAAVPGLELHAARDLVAARSEEPFADLSGFRARLPATARPLAGLALDVRSRYTVLASRARAGRIEVGYLALIALPGAAHEGLVWRRPWL